MKLLLQALSEGQEGVESHKMSHKHALNCKMSSSEKDGGNGTKGNKSLCYVDNIFFQMMPT